MLPQCQPLKLPHDGRLFMDPHKDCSHLPRPSPNKPSRFTSVKLFSSEWLILLWWWQEKQVEDTIIACVCVVCNVTHCNCNAELRLPRSPASCLFSHIWAFAQFTVHRFAGLAWHRQLVQYSTLKCTLSNKCLYSVQSVLLWRKPIYSIKRYNSCPRLRPSHITDISSWRSLKHLRPERDREKGIERIDYI